MILAFSEIQFDSCMINLVIVRVDVINLNLEKQSKIMCIKEIIENYFSRVNQFLNQFVIVDKSCLSIFDSK